MEEEIAARYWCHMCSQTVNPVMEAEIKCPFCQSGFIEEIEEENEHVSSITNDQRPNQSLWSPILMEITNDPLHRTRNQSVTETGNANRETDLDSQLEEILRRRRRHSAAVLQLLQGIRAGLTLEPNSDDPERQRVILINPFNQTITVQTSVGMDTAQAGSLGDYFIGPGFEMLLQRLAENDPNKYGTPPARKEDIEALATVKIEDSLQCSVCLDEFEIGTEAKEMPCKHKFHGDCLFPWLELHSSCPVCRYQLPVDETKAMNGNNGDSNASATSSHGTENNGGNRQEDGGNRSGFSIPWPFSTLFSSSNQTNQQSRDSS